MSETLIAFVAGTAWLAVFTVGLFAFADWVQRRDKRRHEAETSTDRDRGETKVPDQPERKGAA